MCDTGHAHDHDRFGFLVDTPEVRHVIDQAHRQLASVADYADRIEALKPAFAQLLEADGWLPETFAGPDEKSRMGDGIGQYALYRAEDGSLCLFSLVIPAGAETPVHDHLAWGLVGVYRGDQSETVYRRLDDGSKPGYAEVELQKEFLNEPGHAAVFAVGDMHSIEYGDDTFFIRVTGGDVESKKTLRFDLEKKSVQVADRAQGQR